MGRRGPIPKAPWLRGLQGDPGKRGATPGPPPAPPLTDAAPPAWLCQEAREEWVSVVPELVRLGIVSDLDRSALCSYCSAVATWRKAQEALAAGGLTYRSPRGLELPRPEVRIERQAAAAAAALARDLGLTPASRARLGSGKPVEDPESRRKAAKFFGGR